MSTITIHTGDFPTGKAALKGNGIALPVQPGQGILTRTIVPLSDIEQIDIATHESVKRVGGTVGWGIAGGVVLGPVGLLAGLLLGGKKKEITFVAKFSGDRKMLATTEMKAYKALLAAAG